MRQMVLRHTPLNEQDSLVVRLHEDEKLKYSQIAAQLGVSTERVRQIYRTAKSRLQAFAEHGDDALSRLPTRAITFITNLDIATRAQTRAAIESGRLSWRRKLGRGSMCWDGQSLRLGGWRTWVILHEWTELPSPPPRSKASASQT